MIIKKIIVNTLLSLLFIFLITTLLLSLLFKINASGVMSDSMHPTIKKYSLVYIKDIKDKDITLKEKDIVLIDADTPFIHRIIDVKEVNEEIMYETKGDHNNSSDGYYNEDKIIGLYKFHIPYIGIFFVLKQARIILLVFVLFMFSLSLFIKVLKK